MPYDFKARHDKLRTRMRAVNQNTVTYTPLDESAIETGADGEPLTATVYEKSVDELLAFGLAVDSRRRDYIISTVDLPGIEPRKGDLITDSTAGLICKVSPMGGEATWRWTNQQRKALRIHTHVEAEIEGSGSGSGS